MPLLVGQGREINVVLNGRRKTSQLQVREGRSWVEKILILVTDRRITLRAV